MWPLQPAADDATISLRATSYKRCRFRQLLALSRIQPSGARKHHARVTASFPEKFTSML